MNINELIKKAHDNAKLKGFYDCHICRGKGGFQIDEETGQICPECNGTGKANKNIGELLMLVVSELGEALEAHRKGNFSNFEEYDHKVKLAKLSGMSQQGAEQTAFKIELSSSFEFELADVCIRIFDICGYLNIDLEKHIELKMKYNETREYKHKGKCWYEG